MEPNRVKLPDVTMVCVDTLNYGKAIHAIQKSLERIAPARTIFFTDVDVTEDYFETVKINHLYSAAEYSTWMIKELGKQKIDTSHILVIQHDGYVLDENQWTDEFLKFSYIGAPWLYRQKNVGNGGFSLRSTELHKVLAEDDFITARWEFEDDAICRTYREYLEDKYGIKFAPEELAHKFAFELHEPKGPTFGFHSNFHKPYKEPIVFRRKAALGDCIQLEPVLAYFHEKGHPIVLDSPYALFFSRHFFPIKDYKNFDHQAIKHRVIDFDLGYEINPRQLHLKSYFEIAGVKDYVLRNPKLNYHVQDENRLFKKYVVIHIDRRETAERNVLGVRWKFIVAFLEELGYTVLQIGRGDHEDVAIQFNTVNDLMMQWLIAGAGLFIGVDSGPANVAVALGVKSVIFFGSVAPHYIHADISRVIAIQSTCPIGKPHCWHLGTTTIGNTCEVDVHEPPCTIIETQTVIEAIKKILQ